MESRDYLDFIRREMQDVVYTINQPFTTPLEQLHIWQGYVVELCKLDYSLNSVSWVNDRLHFKDACCWTVDLTRGQLARSVVSAAVYVRAFFIKADSMSNHG